MARCPAGHESEASDYCDTCGLVIGAEPAGVGSADTRGAGTVAATGAPAVAGAPAASGGRCPVCQAERNGRFCEECGYDFDLAEALPEVTLIPGVPPAEPAPESAAEPEPEPAGGAGGLDLDAEIARAEAEAAGSAAAAPAASDPVAQPQAEPAAAEPAGTASPGAGTALAVPDPSAGLASVLSPAPAPTGGISLVVDADLDYYKAQVERGDIIESEFPFPKYPHERRFTFDASPIRIGRASASRGLAPEIDLTGPPLDPAVSHLHAQLLRHDEGWVVVDLGSANGTRLNDAAEPLEAETEIPINPGDRIHLGVFTTITVQ